MNFTKKPEMGRRRLALLSAVVASLAAAATEYTYTDPVFYVTNPAGSLTNDLSECTFTKSVGGETSESSWSEFAAATTGTLVKQGTGWITVTSDLSSFNGELHVEAGVWDVCNQYGIGSYLGGAAFAHDGATIVMERKPEYMSWVPPYNTGNTKSLVMEGEGAEGMGGALVARGATGNSDFFALTRYPTLTNDATILIDQTGVMMNWRPAAILRLNGNTLTVKAAPGRTRPYFWHNDTETEAGNLVLDNIQHHHVSRAYFYGGPDCRLTLKGQSDIRFQNVYAADANKRGWTIDYRDVRRFDLTSGSYDGWAYMTGGTNSTLMAWYGPILLGCDMRLYNASSTASATLPKRHRVGLNLHGCISGDYGIGLYPDAKRYTTDITLGLHCPTNTFTGGVTLGEGSTLALSRNGALPAGGGAASITNGVVLLDGGETYSLPALNIHGTGLVAQASFAGGRWASVTKTGDGLLDYDASAGAALLDVRGGIVRLMAKPHRELYAGLSEWTNRSNYTAAMNNGSYYGQSSLTSLYVRVAGYQNGEVWATNHWPKSQYQYPAATCGLSYRGYIWNNSGETETWTFASVMDKAGKILIDDEVVVDQTVRNEAKTANAVITPGAHKFEFRYYNTSGNSGASSVEVTSGVTFKYIDDVLFDYEKGKNPCYATTDNGDGTITTNGCWKNAFGFGIDRQGRRSHFYTDYVQPKDPGDGSLFTTTTNIEDLVLAPVFDVMKFAPGTTLDLGGQGAQYSAASVEGLPAVTNGSIAVGGTWTVSANDVAAGGRMAVDGALSFGDAAAICVTESGHLSNSPEGGWTMAEAEGGISLAEGWQGRATLPSGKYALSLSPDGKRLVLTRTNGFMLTIR